MSIKSLAILKEASQTDIHNIEMVSESQCVQDILEMHRGLEQLPGKIGYSAEMVPVIQWESNVYVIEYDNLTKCMSYYKEQTGFCDEETAVKKIAESNGISVDQIAVVIESENEFKKQLSALTDKIKKEKNPTKKIKLSKQLNLLKAKMKSLIESEFAVVTSEKCPIIECDYSDEDDEYEEFEDDDEYEDDEYDGEDDFIEEAIIDPNLSKAAWFRRGSVKDFASDNKQVYIKAIDSGDWTTYQKNALDFVNKAKTEEELKDFKKFMNVSASTQSSNDTFIWAFLFNIPGAVAHTLLSKHARETNKLRKWINSDFKVAYDKKMNSFN